MLYYGMIVQVLHFYYGLWSCKIRVIIWANFMNRFIVLPKVLHLSSIILDSVQKFSPIPTKVRLLFNLSKKKKKGYCLKNH